MGDDSACDDCDPGSLVRRYSYKPDPRFLGAGPLYLGVELEIIVPTDRFDRCAREAADATRGTAYLKHDTSIQPNGFELVTHPMDYPWAMNRFPWPLLDRLRELGCRSDDRVGLHVHASRAGFSSPAHIFRWAKLIYRNQAQTTALARRNSPYAQFSSRARSRTRATAKGELHRFGLDRYQAINPHPRHTLEVRVFAGSLDPCRVQAALGFVAASVEYTRALTAAEIARAGGWQWSRFAAWVHTHAEYAPLAREMEATACAC
ncbi:amidoligase family protein [Nocardia terpenica]|uniref:amidoligase family protein n=1 Tax=Nocardia terpenica TaxID=455432 RepID=UPI001E451472|nr:amidoligase family protein [Nocardia terpenica]